MKNVSLLDNQFIKSEVLKLYFIPGQGLGMSFKGVHAVPIFFFPRSSSQGIYTCKQQLNSYEFLQSQAGGNAGVLV